MIICLCEGISDREIRAAARSGQRSVSEISRRCGAGSGCGQCISSVKKIIKSVAGQEIDRKSGHPDHCHNGESALG